MNRKHHSVTLKEIAAKAGCGISCVSTILNNAKGNSAVGEKMRSEILRIAAELGYRPNYAGRVLKTCRSKTIGVYVEPRTWTGLGYRYENVIFTGIERTARRFGYDLLALNMSTSQVPEVCEEYLSESRIDGVILLHASRNAEWVERLASRHSNVVVAVDCCPDNRKLSRILFNESAAMDLAVRNLKNAGYRKIGMIADCTDARIFESVVREDYFLRSMKKFRLPVCEEWIFRDEKATEPIAYSGDYSRLEGCHAMHYFAALNDPPDAVIVYNSLVAAYALMEAGKMNDPIPERMAMIGFDDFDFLRFVRPRLTVVDHGFIGMGAAGAELLIDLIENRKKAPQCILTEPELISGETLFPVR